MLGEAAEGRRSQAQNSDQQAQQSDRQAEWAGPGTREAGAAVIGGPTGGGHQIHGQVGWICRENDGPKDQDKI